MISEEDVYQHLEHHGIKGMRWGVRRRGRVARTVAVGKGKGNIIDKARVYTMSNPTDLIRTRSYRKSAARKGVRLTQRNERMARGKTKVRDILPNFAAMRYGDLLPSVGKGPLTADKKRNLAKMSSGQEFVLAALAIGTVTVALPAITRAVRGAGAVM